MPAGATKSASTDALDRVQLVGELLGTTNRVGELLYDAYRQVAAAEVLVDPENIERVIAKLREAGVGAGTDELGELRHKMLVLNNSLAEVDAQTISIAGHSTHELAAMLDSLLIEARSDLRESYA
jgi:hypothetical protein